MKTQNTFPKKTAVPHSLPILICTLALLCFLLPHAQANTVSIDTVRIGLYYGDNQMTSANLTNETGTGYRFGYYNNKTDFVPLAYSHETSITMVITQNLYLSGSSFTTEYTETHLGSYHALHSTGYDGFDQAQTVADTLTHGFVAWVNGEYQVRSGHYFTQTDAATHAAAVGGLSQVVGTSGYGINIVKTGTTQLLFQFDGGASKVLAVEQDLTGHSDPQVWFRNILYRGAFQYQRVTQGNMVVSNVLPLETYLKGVVPYEMSGSWNVEALKAQAVSARTYAVRQATQVNHSSENFDLCNSAHCQVYYGNGGPNINSPTANSDQAVEETTGMFLWYGSSLAGTFYSSSHGGASEAVSNVWSSSSQSTYPYLCGVIDPYEQLADSLNSRSDWTVSFTKTELNEMLQFNGMGIDTSVSKLETVFSDTGNVIKLIIHWENGKTNSVGPSELRYSNWFGLPSIHFIINETLPSVVQGSSSNGYLYNINGTVPVTSFQGLYGIDGDGNHYALEDTPHIITGTGEVATVEELYTDTGEASGGSYSNNLLEGSHFSQGDVFHFNGSGWGHNIGMSQFGAYAMATYLGMSYIDILEFYYPGTNVEKSA